MEIVKMREARFLNEARNKGLSCFSPIHLTYQTEFLEDLELLFVLFYHYQHFIGSSLGFSLQELSLVRV